MFSTLASPTTASSSSTTENCLAKNARNDTKEPFAFAICVVYTGTRATVIDTSATASDEHLLFRMFTADLATLGLNQPCKARFSRSVTHPGALEVWWRAKENSVCCLVLVILCAR